jgi:hypothetical protein
MTIARGRVTEMEIVADPERRAPSRSPSWTTDPNDLAAGAESRNRMLSGQWPPDVNELFQTPWKGASGPCFMSVQT